MIPLEQLEMMRAVAYAVGALGSLYLCIEFANLNRRGMAGVMGTLFAFLGSLLLSIAVRYLGMDGPSSRAIVTPAALLLAAALLIAVWRHWRGGKEAPRL